jgi:hypothetical protein
VTTCLVVLEAAPIELASGMCDHFSSWVVRYHTLMVSETLVKWRQLFLYVTNMIKEIVVMTVDRVKNQVLDATYSTEQQHSLINGYQSSRQYHTHHPYYERKSKPECSIRFQHPLN